jgi:hypothetical protein
MFAAGQFLRQCVCRTRMPAIQSRVEQFVNGSRQSGLPRGRSTTVARAPRPRACAGVPTLILWTGFDQQYWEAAVKRLKVGTARRFSSATQKSLVADPRTILAPQDVTRAREIATRMTKPAASVAAAADLVETFARLRRVG